MESTRLLKRDASCVSKERFRKKLWTKPPDYEGATEWHCINTAPLEFAGEQRTAMKKSCGLCAYESFVGQDACQGARDSRVVC